MLTRVQIWDNENGYVPITAEQAAQSYEGRISSCSGLLCCSICGESVVFTADGQRKRHFRHAPKRGLSADEVQKLCEERSKRQEHTSSTSNGIPSHTLPLKINIGRYGFSFSAGFNTFGLLDEFKASGRDLNDSTITIAPSGQGLTEEDRYVFRLNRLSDNCLTWLPVSPVPFERCALNYRNVHSQLRSLWPESIDGFSDDSAVFDGVTCCRIPHGARVSCKKTFILLSVRSYSHDEPAGMTIRELDFEQSVDHRASSARDWHLYKISVEQMNREAADFFRELGMWLVQTTSDVEQVWPPHLSIGDISVNQSSELFFINPENDPVRLIPSGNLIEQRSCTGGTLVSFNMMHRAQLYMMGTSGLYGYRFIRQEKQLERSGSLPSLTFLNQSAQLVTCDCQLLEAGAVNQLRFSAPARGHLTVSDGKRIRNIIKFDADRAINVLDDNLRPGWTLEFYLGCDLVQTIKIAEPEAADTRAEADESLPEPDSAPQEKAAPARDTAEHEAEYRNLDMQLLEQLMAAASAAATARTHPGQPRRCSPSQLRHSQANKTGRRLSRQLTHAPHSRAWLEHFMTVAELSWPMIRLINSNLLRQRHR